MKTKFGLTVLLLTIMMRAVGQPADRSEEIVKTYPLEITFNKTSSIIFPAVIKSVDRGSRDILAQKAKGVGNVLQLKAGRENFPETNVTVITADGILHQFNVNYSDQPKTLTTDMSNSINDHKSTQLLFQTAMTETDMEHSATDVVKTKRRHIAKESQYKISLALNGVYIKDDVMFYRFRMVNQSNINYDIDFLKFYVHDKAKVKRTASQELEIKPLYIYGDDKVVKGKSSTDIVYALPKFTIPESKLLEVELFEGNGGRHLNLEVKSKRIDNARPLQ
jgi:conjugative transposon TraN protein